MLGSTVVKAEDQIATSTVTTEDVRDKIVELHITFAPAPNAEIKKQRKMLTYTKTGKAICSGSFVSPYGHILTAKHCVQDATDISVVLRDGQEYQVSGKTISKTQDLAIVQIGKFKNPYFELANPLKQGEPVWIYGSPLGITGTLTQGIVARLAGDWTLLDCTALPGNSGGPVVNSKGQLCGVLSAIIIVYLGPSHISIAQSVDSIMMFFYELAGGR